eukprot:jgi/Mesen1/2623/ME000166S01744
MREGVSGEGLGSGVWGHFRQGEEGEGEGAGLAGSGTCGPGGGSRRRHRGGAPDGNVGAPSEEVDTDGGAPPGALKMRVSTKLTVLSLGKIVVDSPHFRERRLLLPLGYAAVRQYPSMH